MCVPVVHEVVYHCNKAVKKHLCPVKDPKENLLGEIEEEYKTRRTCLSQPVRAR